MPAQTVIKLRRSTAAQWTTANPVLGAGEPGLETDTNKVKFGDGTTAWNSLAYSVTSDIEVAVKNSTAATITKGSVVYISGADGNNPTIALAQANSEMTSSKTLGFVKADIAAGATGTVVTEGMLDGLNTNAAPSAGDPIWLSPTTAGGVVYGLANKPVAPNHMVFLGYVVRKQSVNGRIYIKVQNGYELDELHDVSITSAATGQVLQYDGSTSLWKNNALTISSVTNLQSTLDGKAATIHTHVAADISNLGTGVATFLTTPTSANLRAAVTDETGSGSLVFSSGPSLDRATISNLRMAPATTVTSGGTLSLSGASACRQIFTGTSTHTVSLNNSGDNVVGTAFEFTNNSTGDITIQVAAGGLVTTVAPGTVVEVVCITAGGATAASWVPRIVGYTTARAAASHTHAMADLTGFEITSPANGQTLTYNSATGKWVNSAAASGGETISSFLLMGA